MKIPSFEETLARLESSFSVRDIASFSLEKAKEGEDASVFLGHPARSGYDFFPVENKGLHISGILKRQEVGSGKRVSDYMERLDDSRLISADAGLMAALDKLVNEDFLLVVHETKVSGIITRADAQKLPVRLHVYTLLSYIETLLGSAISLEFPDSEAWVELLGDDRKAELEQRRRDLAPEFIDPPLIDCADIRDKVKVVNKALPVPKAFDHETGGVIELRNSIAHPRPLFKSKAGFMKLVKRIQRIRRWITWFQEYITSATAPLKDDREEDR